MPTSLFDYVFGDPYKTMQEDTSRELATRKATMLPADADKVLSPGYQRQLQQRQAYPDRSTAFGPE